VQQATLLASSRSIVPWNRSCHTDYRPSTFPDADIPTVALSLRAGLDPVEHLRIGQLLEPLRDEGVAIIASGMSYHNMRDFMSPMAAVHSEAFDAWLSEVVTAAPGVRDEELARWSSAPSARQSHPREEHLLPLMVAAGAAGEDKGRVDFSGMTMGARVSGHVFG
jgi:aromatic ring-opening dioxygenase catalytic subunit (LigB family)